MGRGSRSLKTAAAGRTVPGRDCGAQHPPYAREGNQQNKVLTSQLLVWDGRVKMLVCSLFPARYNSAWKNSADRIKRKGVVLYIFFFKYYDLLPCHRPEVFHPPSFF